MTKGKKIIEVEKEFEKEVYRMCHELKVYGKCIVENHNGKSNSANRKFGVRAKPLIDAKPPLLYPMGKTIPSRKKHKNMRYWITPPDVKIEETKGKKKSFFRFFR